MTSRRRIVTIEEHFLDPAVAVAGAVQLARHSPGFAAAGNPDGGLPHSPAATVIADLDEGRLADMDTHGIDMQVLSGLSTQSLPADVAVPLSHAMNDLAATAVARHPSRFAGFAALPTADPTAAVDELTRCIDELGFVGTMVHGRTDGLFLSDPRFAALLARIEALDVPLYLHPAPPPLATSAENYNGFDPIVSARFQTAAWGWHNETGIHFVNLYLAGVFDRHPALTMILGHWGELLPFYLDRLDEALPTRMTGLGRGFAEVFRQNVYVTPSGMFTQANLDFCVAMLGADRVMFSVDYPFVPHDGAAAFIEQARLSDAEKDAIAHGTADALLRLR